MVTVPDDLSQETLSNIKDDVLESLRSKEVRGVIFDLSSVRVLDSHEFTELLLISKIQFLHLVLDVNLVLITLLDLV